MKRITISLTATFRELKECICVKLKWLITSKRKSLNAIVLQNLEKEICNELNSEYWNNDITPYMRKELTMGFPNGRINKLINKAFKELI